jgi:hypothetical protein
MFGEDNGEAQQISAPRTIRRKQRPVINVGGFAISAGVSDRAPLASAALPAASVPAPLAKTWRGRLEASVFALAGRLSNPVKRLKSAALNVDRRAAYGVFLICVAVPTPIFIDFLAKIC